GSRRRAVASTTASTATRATSRHAPAHAPPEPPDDEGGRARERSRWPTGSGGIGAAQRARSAREQRTGPQMLIVIGADHGGVELKEALVAELRARGEEVLDVGTAGPASVDYPD